MAALTRVRSSAASTTDSSARAATSAASGRDGAGRLSTASALRRLTRAWSRRSLALLTASRALSRAGSSAGAATSRFEQSIDLLAGLHQLTLGAGDAILGRAAVLGRLARSPPYCRARACASAASATAEFTRPISSSSSSRTRRSPAATLSLSDTNTSAMRPGTCATDAHLAARPTRRGPGPMRPTTTSARAFGFVAARRRRRVGLGRLGRLGREGLRHVVADAQRQDRGDDQHVE